MDGLDCSRGIFVALAVTAGLGFLTLILLVMAL
jgi:hypothetical protein